MFDSKQKERCKKINSILSKKDFLRKICQYSNNNYNEVVTNISLIINYYLKTNDIKTDYTLEELIIKSKSVPSQTEFLVCPTNSIYLNHLRISGLNPHFTSNTPRKYNLDILDGSLSAYPCIEDIFYSEIHQDIKEAIYSSFTKPSSLYKSILKQPQTKEIPIVVGNTESQYYHSILEIRLKNVGEQLKSTCAKITKKTVNKILEHKPLLAIFPKSGKTYAVSETDIDNHNTGLFIPPTTISYITLPSKYQIINTCAKNKKLFPGELLDFSTGEIYEKKVESEPIEPLIIYSRYEKMSITKSFEYANQELSGDTSYDIDLIYGQLDSNNSRPILYNNEKENLSKLQRSTDITVRKMLSGKYEIRNGRHRILYLKNFYLTNYESYKKDNKLEQLRELVTIPMNVESTITDELTNEYMLKFYQLDFQSLMLKSNINDDEPDLIIIFKNNAYHISNNYELIELYNELKNNNYINKYYLGQNDNAKTKENNKLFDYLILELKEKIYTMTFSDILDYLLKEGIKINNEKYSIVKLNYYVLYLNYIDLQHIIQRNKIYNQSKDVIKIVENKFIVKELSKRIRKILEDNPDYLSLSWDDLSNILITYPILCEYSKDLLEESCNLAGYQKLRLEYLYKDMQYTKRIKL